MKEKVLFLGKVPTPLANALRRACINRVRTLAIDEVIIHENTTYLFDEFIAHRLGTLPIRTPEGVTDDYEVVLDLEAEGPRRVMSSDLKGEAEIPYEIPLFTLGDGQYLRLQAIVRPGYGRTHAKFQPCMAYYVEKEEGYELHVIPYGQIPPERILKEALEALEKDLKELQGLV